MTKIFVKSCEKATNWYPADGQTWACISISSSPFFKPELSKHNRIDLLSLYFWDVTHDRWCDIAREEGEEVFEEYHAAKIIEFVERIWNKVDILMIHCGAGISRSAAVASVVAEAKLGTDGGFFLPPYYPNERVCRILKEKWGLPVASPQLQLPYYPGIQP